MRSAQADPIPPRPYPQSQPNHYRCRVQQMGDGPDEQLLCRVPGAGRAETDEGGVF
jgi:hypothetical protein